MRRVASVCLAILNVEPGRMAAAEHNELTKLKNLQVLSLKDRKMIVPVVSSSATLFQ